MQSQSVYVRSTRGGGIEPHLAFTLAEVLITLGIIGVVAAITMPSLIANYKEKVLVLQIKRAYSEMEQALNMYAYKNNCINVVCISDLNSTSEELTKKLYEQFKGAKFCSEANKRDKICQSVYVKQNKPQNNGSGQTGWAFAFDVPFFVSSSGAAYKLMQYNECIREIQVPIKDENGNIIKDADGNNMTTTAVNDLCAEVFVDANGTFKGPGQLGADVHSFYFTSKSEKLEFDQKKLFQKVITEGKLYYTPYQVGVEWKK